MSGNYRSVFDIIGPIMIGPSSSHTAGAVAIGRVGNALLDGSPDTADIHYYESFAQTHLGHGTDYAIIGGLLGFETDDLKVPDSLAIAQLQGMKVSFYEEKGDSPIGHPNTAICRLRRGDRTVSLSACSIGGGLIEVRDIQMDGFHVQPTGPLPILMIVNNQAQLAQRIEEQITSKYKVNHAATYSDDQARTLYEFELENKLKVEELSQLTQLGQRIVYL